MKRLVLAASALLFTCPSWSQEEAQDLPLYRPDPKVIREVMLPPSRFGKLLFDLFEYHVTSEEREGLYDVEFWYGGDFNRVWVETEGEHSFKSGEGTLERLDLYYARLITPFWDFRVGAGVQAVYGEASDSRTYAVVGFQGLAPYWFEVDANLRVDTEGKVSADLELEYDLLFTQRLILQPRLETLVSFSDIPDVGVWSGLNNLELGLRLRYEIRREFAPYVGVSWTTYFGKAKDARRSAGEDTSLVNLLLGVRMWF
jgi:copper resistance protein B